jgi:transposase
VIENAEDTPVAMRDPGAGKTRRTYVWAYARGAFNGVPGVINELCIGRGARFLIEFLGVSDDAGEVGAALWCATNTRPTISVLSVSVRSAPH